MHFFKHAKEMGINMDSNMEDIMEHFNLLIIMSADDQYSIEKLKDLEADIMQTMKTTLEHGGMNIILERRDDQKQMVRIIYQSIKEGFILITGWCVISVYIQQRLKVI